MNLSPETILKIIKYFSQPVITLQAGLQGYSVHTQGQFLPRVRGEGEAQHRHAGDEDAGDDEVTEVVEGPPTYLDGEGDVQVGGGAALVPHLVPLGRNTCSRNLFEELED